MVKRKGKQRSVKTPTDLLKDKKWIKKEGKRIMKELGTSEIPSPTILVREGYNAFRYAIIKYHGGFPAARREIFEQETVSGSAVRDKRFRDLDYCLQRANDVIERHELDNLPSHRRLIELGEGRLAQAIIDYHMGYESFRERLNLPSLNERVDHNENAIIAEAKKVIEEEGLETLPPHRELFYMGHKALAAAIINSGIGFRKIREKLGERKIRAERGSLRNWDSFSARLQKLIDQIGHFPSLKEFEEKEETSLEYAIYNYYGGMKSVRERMGYEIIEPIRSESQLVDFLKGESDARELAGLASVTENTSDIANLLTEMWPDRFPSAAQLARSLPSAVRKIGYSLHPFTMEKARGLYEKTRALPNEIRYALDDLLYNITLDQYQTRFNQDPNGTLEELKQLSKEKNGVSKLAKRVYDSYQEVYDFSIPGHGRLRGVA